MRRRVLLQRVGIGVGTVTAVGATAGCLDDGDVDNTLAGNGTDDDSAANATDGDEPIEPPSIVSEAIETTETSCASGTEAVSEAIVDTGDGRVEIGGSLEAPNPCYEAVLAAVDLVDSGTELAVTIDTERGDEYEFCQECLGRIEYAATIEFEGGVPEAVIVTHAERDSEAVVEEAETDGSTADADADTDADAGADPGSVENGTATDE